MAWLRLTCHHYCRPTNLGGLYDLRVNISWRHLVFAWKVLASVVLRRMPLLLSGTRSPSPSSVTSPLTCSRAVWRHICLMSHVNNYDVTFLSYCVYFPSFCLVSVWYHKRFWAWRLVAVKIGAIENWHYYYHYYYLPLSPPPIRWDFVLCSSLKYNSLNVSLMTSSPKHITCKGYLRFVGYLLDVNWHLKRPKSQIDWGIECLTVLLYCPSRGGLQSRGYIISRLPESTSHDSKLPMELPYATLRIVLHIRIFMPGALYLYNCNSFISTGNATARLDSI